MAKIAQLLLVSILINALIISSTQLSLHDIELAALEEHVSLLTQRLELIQQEKSLLFNDLEGFTVTE
mgnify:CR=1 FL=1